MMLGSLDDPLYLFYCKCKKDTGKPIIIKHDKNEWSTHKVRFRKMDAYMSFNNSPPSISRRGATTVLIFTEPVKVTKHSDGSYTFTGNLS